MQVVSFVQLALDGNFDGTNVLLWTYPSELTLFDAIPSLRDISVTPAVIDPGRSIGQRESVRVTFTDHLHKFDTDAFTAGTFWSKFRARYPTLQGLPLRIYRGERGQALADMQRLVYVVDSYQVNESGAIIMAKDPLTLVLSSTAQAPNVNTGELLAAIDADDTSITLAPSGIGNIEYPAAGYACIGGNEVVTFTRSADTVTITARGVNLGGIGVAHDAGSKFQFALNYNNATPSEIIYDLFTNYTDVDPTWIILADWQTDVDAYIGRLYDATLPAPVAVNKLLDELCEQIGLTLYWDTRQAQLRLKPLAPPSSSFNVDTGNVLKGTFDVQEQPDKRVSEVWTYYAQRDVTRPLDEEANYRRVAVTLADNESDYRQTAIKKIYSRWIALDNASAAERVNDMTLSRYKVPPRRVTFSLFRTGEALPKLANLVTASHWRLVDTLGAAVSVAAQVVSEQEADDRVTYAAEEVLYDASIDTTKYVYIDVTAVNVNLRERFDSTYSAVTSADDVVFVIQTGVTIGTPWMNGGTNIADIAFLIQYNYAVNVGDWPENPNSLKLIVNGAIRAGGGAGAVANMPLDHGGQGRGGLYTRVAIDVINNGVIAGGGGGGGASASNGGGGGAGFSLNGLGIQDYAPGGPGSPNVGYPTNPPAGSPGAVLTGGAGGGGTAGAGGGPGQAGTNGTTNNGGAAGPAVDGDSYVTWVTPGTILGPQIN